ncbi:MAG: hypothetical protein GF418_15640 [Chitinivibrionales bacterium]|nr:hypothetical protein [Chitinivibrionales bacterium]MBD3397054.1 hypothetical protein [Chitinivibrionales bacterium]
MRVLLAVFCLASINVAQSLEVFNLQSDSAFIDTTCDTVLTFNTIHYDSSFSCAGDSCVWKYQTKTDTVTKLTCSHDWRIYLSFDLYEVDNSEVRVDSVRFEKHGQSGFWLRADSIRGDTLTMPGHGKHLAAYAHVPWPHTGWQCITIYVSTADGTNATCSDMLRSTEIRWGPVSRVMRRTSSEVGVGQAYNLRGQRVQPLRRGVRVRKAGGKKTGKTLVIY